MTSSTAAATSKPSDENELHSEVEKWLKAKVSKFKNKLPSHSSHTPKLAQGCKISDYLHKISLYWWCDSWKEGDSGISASNQPIAIDDDAEMAVPSSADSYCKYLKNWSLANVNQRLGELEAESATLTKEHIEEIAEKRTGAINKFWKEYLDSIVKVS